MKISEITPTYKKPGPKRQRPLREANTKLLVNLGSVRQKYGLSLRDVSGNSDIDTASLLRAEQGATPSLENALKIAKLFDIPVEKIWALKRNK